MLFTTSHDVGSLMDFIGQNLPPVLFLTLLVVCALMIIAGAVLDWLPAREPKAAADDETQTNSGLSKAEKKKAQAEAKARKKEEQARKKAEKAAARKKGKKGKSQEESAPAASEETEPGEPTGETIDFSMPEPE